MADKKVTALDALVELNSVDLFLVVDDPSGTPTSKKVAAAAISEFVIDNIVFPAGVEDLDDLGDVTAPSPSSGDVLKYNGSAWVNDAGYATLSSPTFTGTPAAPTAAAGTSTTQVATTAFVVNSSQDDQFMLAAAIFTS
jgi:hypothetical protein